ncbi:hypothetical protein B9T16_25225, partial [Arthrospira sp. PCC 8006]|uniref:hormogonium polysaccharide biosynthesis protein HpsA n=1 Tax=Arthrospira sp. PCC 8006 TaxID=1982224 RepID=UPI00396DB3C8
AGDTWRRAAIVSDAVTLLSSDFREGYRWEGDYNLRNNMVLSQDYRRLKQGKDENELLEYPVKLEEGYDVDGGGISSEKIFNERYFGFDLNGNGSQVVFRQDEDGEDITVDDKASEEDLTLEAVRRINGFYDNNFMTSQNVWRNNSIRLWIGGAITRSSYVNNYVTPIQTRGNGIEYVMEMCRKPLVSMCKPGDWVVSPPGASSSEEDELMNKIGDPFITSTADNQHTVGSTVQIIFPASDRIYPRRIAFLRDKTHKLVLDRKGHTIPLGVVNGEYNYSPLQDAEICVDNDDKISLNEEDEYDTECTNGTWETFSKVTTKRADALLFQMDGDVPKVHWEPRPRHPDDDDNYKYLLYAQPLWEPVVQLNTIPHSLQNLLQQAVATTFNLIVASGDSPIRLTVGKNTELNGGFHNFSRFLERWNGVDATIKGGFFQFKRSAYASGPMMPVLNQDDSDLTKFGPPLTTGDRPYRSLIDNGQVPFYRPPVRNYGYDVALMNSEDLDLFATRLTTPATQPPDEYFREVSRDDPWVHTLMCGTKDDGNHFLGDELRPDECPLSPGSFLRRS